MPLLNPGAEASDAITLELQRQRAQKQLEWLNNQHVQEVAAAQAHQAGQDALANERENRLVQTEQDNVKIRQQAQDQAELEKFITTLAPGDVVTDPKRLSQLVKAGYKMGPSGLPVAPSDQPLLRPQGSSTAPADQLPMQPGMPVAPSAAAPPAFPGTAAQRVGLQNKAEADQNFLDYQQSLPPTSPLRQQAEFEHGTGKQPLAEALVPKAPGRRLFTDPRAGTTVDMATGQAVTDARPGDVQVDKQYPPVGTSQDTLDARKEALRAAGFTNALNRLDTLRKPLLDQQSKMEDARTVLNQNTMAADALVGPKVLSAVVGGPGSGLRMTNAELTRMAQGNTLWEEWAAKLQRFNLDGTTGFLVPPEQRAQFKTLLDAIEERNLSKMETLQQAEEDYRNAPDVKAQEDIRVKLDKALSGGGKGNSGGGNSGGGASGPVTVAGKNGKSYTFPNQAAADAFKKDGG